MIKLLFGWTLALIILTVLIVLIVWAALHVMAWWEFGSIQEKIRDKALWYMDKLEEKYKDKK